MIEYAIKTYPPLNNGGLKVLNEYGAEGWQLIKDLGQTSDGKMHNRALFMRLDLQRAVELDPPVLSMGDDS